MLDTNTLGAVEKILPPDAFSAFQGAAVEASEQGFDHNECIRAGWAVVKEDWQRPDTGKVWVAKENPSGGSVHVDTPMGDDSKKKPKKKPPEKVPDSENVEKAFASVCKVDEGLGLVFGWAIVCKVDGKEYFDTQGDYIPEDAMMKASADFMENSRMAADMHPRDENNTFQPEMANGTIVFAFPMTEDVAKALGIETRKTGLLIAMKPPADILEKFKSNEYTGFSVGGYRITDEDVDG